MITTYGRPRWTHLIFVVLLLVLGMSPSSCEAKFQSTTGSSQSWSYSDSNARGGRPRGNDEPSSSYTIPRILATGKGGKGPKGKPSSISTLSPTDESTLPVDDPKMPPPHTELPEEEDVENPDDDVGDGDDDDGMDDDFTESPTSSTPAPTLSTPAPTPSTPAPTPSTPAPSMSDIVDDDILLSEIPTVSPSVNEEEVSPTEIEEEQSRSRSLFPFSLEISGQMGIEDVDEVMESYLLSRLTAAFDNLESILLSVSTARRRQMRRLRQKQQEEEKEERLLQDVVMFDFIGVAVFFEADDTVPSEEDVQREQLLALQDFGLFKQFIKEEEKLDWEVVTVVLDGMTIVEDGMLLGDTPILNEEDSLARGSLSASEDNNGATVAISLVTGFLFILVGVGLFIVRKKQNEEELIDTDGEKLFIEETMAQEDQTILDQNVSYETVTLATGSFDSINVSGSHYQSNTSPQALDWNRVFALSQSPVEEMMKDVFEAKALKPPKTTRTHEIITLTPVQEEVTSSSQRRFFPEDDKDKKKSADDGDSYGYDSFPGDGADDTFVVSSPVAAIPAAEYSGQDQDLTMDLSELLTDMKNQRKLNSDSDEADEEWG